MPTNPLDPALLQAAIAEQEAALDRPGQPAPGPVRPAEALLGHLVGLVLFAAGREQMVVPARRRAVRAAAALLAARAPGRSVEVRVPPDAAIQCVAGPRHTRGTPSAVVETDPLTFLRLAAGECTWAEASASGLVRASGQRTDLSEWLPLVAPPG